ncbi:hypothetical protein FACS1894139_04410 [Planctomycetales bacterium]|nr:hypothetical protein FACS1894107_02070 [Planctomycetales bacterium]GHT03644.1 hypothetical protein FACS1894139_04410 [Planctomycetales bacterium]
MNLHTSKAIIAKAYRLKKSQQKELPDVLKRNWDAEMCYDELSVKIAGFIRQEVIPTKNADLMLAVGLTFAQIELEANENAPDRVKISLQNTVAEYEQAGISRKENMRSLKNFRAYNASYQAKHRSPRNDKFGSPVDAVHHLVASERARNNNAQIEPTLSDALRQERTAKIDLCEALLHQHKIEQRDWIAKLQEQQNSASLNPQDVAAGEKRYQLVTDANGKEYYQFAHRDDEGNPFYCEAPTLDECRHACDVWTVTKYLDGKVENPNPLVKEFVERTKAIRDDASAELAKKWGLPYEQKPANKTGENEKPKTVEKEVAPVKRDAGMSR